mgnify:CR=1 FL=1
MDVFMRVIVWLVSLVSPSALSEEDGVDWIFFSIRT